MYKSLQAGRAISALLVVLYHLGGSIAEEKFFGFTAFSTPFSFGSAGVIFFFVLSGFIIAFAHQNDIFKPQKLHSYIQKRFLRIYPTYWIIFLLVFFLALPFSATRNLVPHDLLIILKSLLLIPQDSKVVGGTGAPVIAVAWTLQYEMLFYLLFASLILSRWLSAIVLIGFALLFVLSWILGLSSLPFPLSFLSSSYLLLFAMGMAVSVICIKGKVVPSKPIFYVWIGFAMFIFIALDTVLGFRLLEKWESILYGLASAIMIYGLVQAENNGQIIGGQGFLQLLGDSSYALYLIHSPLISALCRLALSAHLDRLGIVGAFVTYFVILCVCLVSAVLFHTRIEKPVADYFRSRLHHGVSTIARC